MFCSLPPLPVNPFCSSRTISRQHSPRNYFFLPEEERKSWKWQGQETQSIDGGRFLISPFRLTGNSAWRISRRIEVKSSASGGHLWEWGQRESWLSVILFSAERNSSGEWARSKKVESERGKRVSDHVRFARRSRSRFWRSQCRCCCFSDAFLCRVHFPETFCNKGESSFVWGLDPVLEQRCRN